MAAPSNTSSSSTAVTGGMSPLLRWVFSLYFATHIPITLLIDAQGVSSAFHPQACKDLLAWYTKEFGDFLMASPPQWFRSVVACELLFQLPFFFVAVNGFWYGKNSMRLPCLVYGAHVATTLVPILDAFAYAPHLTSEQKTTLIGIYSPYLLVPLLLVWVMWKHESPFGTEVELPMGHPKGGDASKCPFANMMGLAAAEGVSVAPSAGGEEGKKKR